MKAFWFLPLLFSLVACVAQDGSHPDADAASVSQGNLPGMDSEAEPSEEGQTLPEEVVNQQSRLEDSAETQSETPRSVRKARPTSAESSNQEARFSEAVQPSALPAPEPQVAAAPPSLESPPAPLPPVPDMTEEPAEMSEPESIPAVNIAGFEIPIPVFAIAGMGFLLVVFLVVRRRRQKKAQVETV